MNQFAYIKKTQKAAHWVAFCFGYQIGFANDWCEAFRYDGKQNQKSDR